MINPTPIASLISAGLVIFILLSQTELWQRKEYRLDRLLSWLNSPTGQRLSLAWGLGLGSLIFAAWLFFFFEQSLNISRLFAWLVIIALTAYHFYRLKKRGLFRPKFTTKAQLIIAVASALIILNFLIFFTSFHLITLRWATLLWSLPLLVAISVIAVNIPADIRKRQIFTQAATHRRKFPDLKVVGITGSYGKTSTKHFALQLIPQAIGTPDHHNSRLGVAQDVLKSLNKKTKIYIAEAGAYTIGEVAEIAAIIQPQIAVITAIGNQHLELFGSQASILKTKWELIKALPPDGIAILNADSPLLSKQKTKNKTITYSTQKPADIYASDIIVKPTSLTCTLHLFSDQQAVSIPLAGAGSLSCALAAAACAYALGLESSTIFSRLQNLKAFPHTMEIKSGRNHSIIIDDSYSANEAGALAAINHLKTFPPVDQRVVLKPLLELGSAAPAAHEKIGQALGQTRAKIFLTETDYLKDIQTGLKSSGYQANPIVITNPQELARAASQNLSNQTVVLLEGRLQDVVRLSFTND